MDVLIPVLDTTIRLAIPLLFACLAGLFSERAGIFDIGLEGKMLAAAFFSAALAAITGSVWLGLLAGIAASVALSAIHGIASITFRGNQLISGVAINFLAAGLTVLIAQDWFQQGGRTPSLVGGARFASIELPFAEALSGVPIFGQIYADLISGHTILVYVGFLCVPLTWWVLFRTRFGLRLRAALRRGRHLRHSLRTRRRLSRHRSAGGFRQGHVVGPGLHRARRPHLRQVAAVVCALRHDALRLPAGALAEAGCRSDDPAVPRSGPVPRRAALCPDGHHPGRFRGQGDPAESGRSALCQGALKISRA